MGHTSPDSGQGNSVHSGGISSDVFTRILEQHRLGERMNKFVGNGALAPRFAFRDGCILVKDEINPWDIREWEDPPPTGWGLDEEQQKVARLYRKLREFQGGSHYTPKSLRARVMMKDGCILIKDERRDFRHRP